MSAETPNGARNCIWLVVADHSLGQELTRQLESFNYRARAFAGIGEVANALHTERPEALIMDFACEDAADTQGLRSLIEALGCPLLIISGCDDFASRVRAAQLGAEGYFLKPLDVPRLVNRMAQIIEKRYAPQQRVLIVEDDALLAEHYRLVLLGAGMVVEVLHSPEDIINTISSFRPELVLMDLHMPAYSGPDLAGVIRQHESWAGLPIVYLSAETDLDMQIQALGRGADEFLSKPVADAQLIAAVRARIERARQLDALIAKDSLTGLLKHASIKEAAEVEVLRARRIGKPVTLAMLDIDHFKSVNDHYGHAVGDVVISAIAMLLRQRLRQSDLIGRYGGEEFVAVLPECDAGDAYHLLDDIRRVFAAVRFCHEGREFTCTVSVGLASSAQYPDLSGSDLLVAADEALYAAKRGGRNQVRVVPV